MLETKDNFEDDIWGVLVETSDGGREGSIYAVRATSANIGYISRFVNNHAARRVIGIDSENMSAYENPKQ